MSDDEFTLKLLGHTAADQLGDVWARLAAIEQTVGLMRDLMHRLSPEAVDGWGEQARQTYRAAALRPVLEGEPADTFRRFAAMCLYLVETPHVRDELRRPEPPA